MGDLSQLAEMMPGGMGKQLAGAEIDPKVMAHTEAIILSMTPEERENPKLPRREPQKASPPAADWRSWTLTAS